jgi:hypothetical protein
MLGVLITSFVVVKRDGREIGNKDNVSISCWIVVYMQHI